MKSEINYTNWTHSDPLNPHSYDKYQTLSNGTELHDITRDTIADQGRKNYYFKDKKGNKSEMMTFDEANDYWSKINKGASSLFPKI